MMRSSLSLLFVLVLFSSGGILVNCDESVKNDKNKDNGWDFFWIFPEFSGSLDTVTSSSAASSNHPKEKTFPIDSSEDFPSTFASSFISPMANSRTGASASASAGSASSFAGTLPSFNIDDDKSDVEPKEEISIKEPEVIKEDAVLPKAEETAPKSVAAADCKEKEPEKDDFIFDCDFLNRLLAILSLPDVPMESSATIKEEKEPAAVDPNVKVYKDYYGYTISSDGNNKKPSLKADITTYATIVLPDKKTLNPSKSIDTEKIEIVPVETTIAESVKQSEAISDSIPKTESIIVDEMPTTTPAVQENKQCDDDKETKKDHPHLFTMHNFLKKIAMLAL